MEPLEERLAMTYPAIEVKALCKRFPLNRCAPSNNFVGNESVKTNLTGNVLHALNDVSFEVKKGEVFGVIGHNGSGKSTLIQILASVIAPTSGEALIDGTVASILDVNSGFHPELTGRENVFLRGALVGMSRKRISERFDEIVAFSQIEEFIDQPVKTYSSGMLVRLAFSVAAHLEADIVLLDEVISVGDAEFRAKSYRKMRELTRSGRTVIIISHELNAIVELCQRALLLSEGKVAKIGPAKEVVSFYLDQVMAMRLAEKGDAVQLSAFLRKHIYELNTEIRDKKELMQALPESDAETLRGEINSLLSVRDHVSDRLNQIKERTGADSNANQLVWPSSTAPGNSDIILLELGLFDSDGTPKTEFGQLEPVLIRMTYQKLNDTPSIPTLLLNYQMSDLAISGNPFFSSDESAQGFDLLAGVYSRQCSVPARTLNTGSFTVDITFIDAQKEELTPVQGIIGFTVRYENEMADRFAYNGRFPGPLFLQMSWETLSSPHTENT